MCHYNDFLCYLSVFMLNLKFLNKCCTVLIKLHWNIFSMSTNWRYLSKYFLLFFCIPLCIFIILSLSIFIHTTKILLVSLVWSAMYVYFHCKAVISTGSGIFHGLFCFLWSDKICAWYVFTFHVSRCKRED